MYKIINITVRSGKRIPVLITKQGIPEYFSTSYILLNRISKSYNTNYRILCSIKYFYSFVESQNLSISKYFSDLESPIFRVTLQKYLIQSSLLSNNSSLTLNMRTKSLESYILWIYSLQELNESKITKIKMLFKLYINNKINIPPKRYDSQQNKDIENELKNFLISPINEPLFSVRHSFRNSLILAILIETGLRIGELLNLRTDDTVKWDNKYYIKVTSHNEFDNRQYKPSIKTIYSVRNIQISNQLFLMIDKYLSRHRKRSKEHRFLLTSDRGSPLSYSSIVYIFSVISKHLGANISAHYIRHIFAKDYLKWLIEIENIEMERAKDELRIVCGWSPSSQMPINYTKDYISDLANQHNIKRIKSINRNNAN